MIVCHCRAVSRHQIEAAALCGATTVREIVAACGAGGRCGGCRPAIEDVLSEAPTALPARRRAAVA